MDIKTAINGFFTNKYTAIAITIIIFVLCSLPVREIPLSTSLNDKLAHFLAFGAWAFCWQGAFGKYIQTILSGCLYGILIEFWQALLPESFHRNFEWYDALADGIGVLTGVFLWKVWCLLKL